MRTENTDLREPQIISGVKPVSLRDRLQLLADMPFKRHVMDHPQGACLWHSHELTVMVLQPRILTIAMAADRAGLVRHVLFASGAQAIEYEPQVLPGVCRHTHNLEHWT